MRRRAFPSPRFDSRTAFVGLAAVIVAMASLSPLWLHGVSNAAPPPPAGPPPRAPAPPGAPAPAPPAPTEPTAVLGQALFFDTTLSNPVGMACATCHAPQAGFTYPVSQINQSLGPVPGIVPGRFGNRKPPTISYAAFIPAGPTLTQLGGGFQAYIGGLFWDGRAANLAAQAPLPMQNPNEMNNVLHNVGDPDLVVQKVLNGPNARLLFQVYGEEVATASSAQVFQLIIGAIVAYEQSSQVSPFNSRYDAVLAGKAVLSASEINGLRLFTGSMSGRPGGPAAAKNAQCSLCHGLAASAAAGPDLFTINIFTNNGIPKNPNNPYYKETNSATNPVGYNPAGAAYIDPGLGGFLYPQMGLPAGNVGAGSDGKGDFLQINGTFKAPTVRNVDLRPNPSFVKCYGHNGYFKSLPQVVHFYNTRNLTTAPGEVIDFTAANPYAGLKGKPLFPAPEYPSPVTLVNPTGAAGGVGNLGLTAQEESDIVSFLKTLSDTLPAQN